MSHCLLNNQIIKCNFDFIQIKFYYFNPILVNYYEVRELFISLKLASSIHKIKYINFMYYTILIIIISKIITGTIFFLLKECLKLLFEL